MSFNVTKLNKAIEVGTIIPMTESGGNIGRWVEDQLEKNGYSVNRQKGIDLHQLGIEVKTRKIDSTSAHTVGSMSPYDIIDNDWLPGNNVFDKVQKQYRVKHQINPLTGDNLVVSAQIYDFTDIEIQSKLKESWDHCRQVLVQNPNYTFEYIRGQDKWAYLELQNNGYYQFRITSGYMDKMEKISNTNKSKLFVFG